MTRVERMTAGWRSAPIAIFGLALLILLGGIAVIALNESTYNRARVEQSQGLAEILAASTAAAVDFDDPGAARQAISAFRANNQVRRVLVFKRDGGALAGFDRSGKPVPPTLSAMPGPSSGVIRVHSPIVQAGQNIGIIYLDIEREAPYRRLSRYLVVVGMFVLAALVVAALGLAQLQLRRANRELGNRAEALAQANVLLEEQIEERGRAEEQLRQSQKMQALGQLTGGIAHDFNNQLTVIQGSADMLARPELSDGKRIRFAQAIIQASTNAASLTSQLLAFARRQPLKPELIDLNTLIRDMDDLLDRTMGEKLKVVTQLCRRPCRVRVDRAQLQSAILNVASNARDAMKDGGVLSIRTSDVEPVDGKRRIGIEMEDAGGGMNADVLERIFEPFFTTKGPGQGTGLGLSQVYGFANQSGGEVLAQSTPGKGTTVTLILPCVDEEGDLLDPPAQAEPTTQAPAAILVVEDNEDVGAFAETLLAELGHHVTRASSGEEAIELARRQSFDVVLSDVVMPGMGGLKLAEILAAEQPDLPVVLATGFSQQIVEGGSGGRPVILKPYRLATLSQALAAAVKSSPTPSQNADREGFNR